MTQAEPRVSPPTPLPDPRLLWGPLVESVDCFVAVIDRHRRLSFLNHCTEGYDSVDDVLGIDMLEFVPKDHQEMVRGKLDEVFEQGQTIHYEIDGDDPAGVQACYAVRVAPVVVGGRIDAAVVTALDRRRLADAETSLVAERVVLRKLIQTQERERQLVSYEIHDGLAQYLASALMRLESCATPVATATVSPGMASAAIAPTAPPASSPLADRQRDCEEGLRLLRAALVEARRLINGLRPPMLDELGIVEAIESLVADIRIEVPEVVFEKPDRLPRLSSEMETTIFRIVQEALTNVRKHSLARRVRVTLQQVDVPASGPHGAPAAAVRVAVTDDGRGFDPRQVSAACFGLEGIRQRARLFGSEASITSRAESSMDSPPEARRGGTIIEVVLPLPAEGGAASGRPDR